MCSKVLDPQGSKVWYQVVGILFTKAQYHWLDSQRDKTGRSVNEIVRTLVQLEMDRPGGR